MANFSSGIEPLTDFGVQGAFGVQDQFDAGQSAVNDRFDEEKKERKKAFRSTALSALGAALSTYASKDPGRTAAQFIEQQARLRNRRQEMATKEQELKQSRLFQSSESKKERDFSSTEKGKDRAQRTDLQEDSQEFTSGEAAKDKVFTLERDESTRNHQLSLQEERLMADRGLTQFRVNAAAARQDKGISADKEATLLANRMEIQRDVQAHLLALGSGNVTENMSASANIAHFLADEIGRDELSTMEQATLDSWGAKEALKSDVAAVSSHAKLFAAITDAATTTDANGLTSFDKNLYDRLIGGLPEELQESLQNAEMEATQQLNVAAEKIDGGETLSLVEMEAITQQVMDSGLPNGQAYIDNLTEMNTEAGGKAPAPNRPGAGGRPNLAKHVNFGGGGSFAAAGRAAVGGVKKLADFFQPLPGATETGADAITDAISGKSVAKAGFAAGKKLGPAAAEFVEPLPEATQVGADAITGVVSGESAAKVGFAAGKRVGAVAARDLLSHPDVTEDTPVWDGPMGETPEGHIVQDPSSGVFMFRRGKFFHAVTPVD